MVDSDVTITASTFSSGSAEDGGALDLNFSTVFIDGSTFSNNTADGSPGLAESRGGAVAADGCTVTIQNSTFTDNQGINGDNQGGAFHARETRMSSSMK